jgi:DNA-binding response OmpR family regulator
MPSEKGYTPMSRELRLLLIDDDPAWLETLADYLETKGFRVQPARDGATGLALVDQGDVALVLVDRDMPDMDGFDFLRQLRRRNSVPVLMVSGEEGAALLPRVLAEGGQGFVPKTASPNLLLRAIRRVLGLTGSPSHGNHGAGARRWYLPVPRRCGRFLPMCLQDQN